MFNWLCVWLSSVLFAASVSIIVQCDTKTDDKKKKNTQRKTKKSETSSDTEVSSDKKKKKKGRKSGTPEFEQTSVPKKPSQRAKSQAASGRAGGRPYRPPPAHERPRHPGFEAPVEPMDENNTVRQVEKFGDAQNFCNF